MDDSYVAKNSPQGTMVPPTNWQHSKIRSLFTKHFYGAGLVPGAGGQTRQPYPAFKEPNVYTRKAVRNHRVLGKWGPRREHQVLWEPSGEEPNAAWAQGRLRSELWAGRESVEPRKQHKAKGEVAGNGGKWCGVTRWRGSLKWSTICLERNVFPCVVLGWRG